LDRQRKNQVTVQRAGPADVGTLVELMGAFYAESDHVLDHASAEASFKRLLADARLGAVWLARASDEASGYIVLALRHSMEFGGGTGVIDDLFVRPPFRRRGVGTHLMAALLQACAELRLLAVEVEVGPDNAAAKMLYRKFRLVAQVPERETFILEIGAQGSKST
jgi:ribosomal protein S18 acetylase RimI-like enzyme